MKGDLSSLVDDNNRYDRLARLASRFVLCSLLSLPMAVMGQQASIGQIGQQDAQTEESAKSMFPALDRITSSSEEDGYSKEALMVRKKIDAFIKKNSNNRPFMLIAEATMDEMFRVQFDKGIYYYVSADSSKITIIDSLKNWKNRILITQSEGGVKIKVETEGEPDCLSALTEGVPASPDGIDKLKARLWRLFDDFFGDDLFLRAAYGD